MIKRICPICDQVMDSAHYCKTCRRWVKNPWVRDVGYYLNERHASDEAQCSYHNDEQAAKRDAAWQQRVMRGADPARTDMSGAGTSPNPARTAAGQKQTGWKQTTGNKAQTARTGHYASGTFTTPGTQVQAGRQTQAGRGMQSKARGKNTVALVILVIVIVMKLISSCSHVIVNMLESGDFSSLERQLGEILDDGYSGDGNTEYDEDMKELTDEEVKALGVHCTDSAHFSVKLDFAEKAMDRILSSNGLQAASEEVNSFNEQYSDGTSWYVTWKTYDLGEGENGYYRCMELDYDTATEELHQISFDLDDPELVTKLAGEMLGELKTAGELADDEDCREIVEREVKDSLLAGEEYHLQSGLILVDGMCYDNGYSVTISRIDPDGEV